MAQHTKGYTRCYAGLKDLDTTGINRDWGEHRVYYDIKIAHL